MNDVERRLLLGAGLTLPTLVAAGTAGAQSGAGQGDTTVPPSSARQEAARAVDPGRPLAGKVAMVTGGARGIGLASALELARLGADIALFDIAQPDALKGVTRYPLASRDDLGSAERDVSNQKVRALAIAGDTRRLEDLEQAVSQTVQTLGSLDIVVANVRRRML